MKYLSINFRLGQILAKNVYFGSYFCNLASKLCIKDRFFKSQLKSIWGPNVNENERDHDISLISLLYDFNSSSSMTHKTIYYLWDRAHFEYRWFDALTHLNLPTNFIWGDSDAVSPVEIPLFFEKLVPNAKIYFIEKAGHFFMLEKPKAWIKEITRVIT